MPRRTTICGLFALLCSASACSGGTDRSASAPGGPTRAAESGAAPKHTSIEGDPAALLTTDRILAMHLTLDAAAMAALADQPRAYVRAALRHGEHTLTDVAVRFKGHRTMRDWSGKPSFKLSFAHFAKGRRFMGLKQLMLDNMVEDPTLLREALGNHAARELGVPAPRTAFVELYVNGELFGLYTLVEAPDQHFLARHFADPSGPLYEGEYGCDLYPGDVVSMELDGGEDEGRALIGALASAAEGPIGALLDARTGLVDGEAFLRFLAVGAMLGDFDGYRNAHNYRLYRDPKTARWSLLPWGLDRVLKTHVDPFVHHSLLARKCLADRDCRLAYVKTLHRVSKRFETLGLEAELERLDALVRDAVARDPRRPHDDGERGKQLERTRKFIRKAPAKLREHIACWDGEHELDGDGDGYGCGDCDDQNPRVHPNAAELCNGADDDCSGLADDLATCGCPEVVVEGGRFALCNLPMPWADAAGFCEALGGHLARIESRAQSKALSTAAGEVDQTLWWIGLGDREREGSMVWNDGSTHGFRHFSGGEPDHHVCGQDCVALKTEKGGGWRDMHCARPRPFICRNINDLNAP